MKKIRSGNAAPLGQHFLKNLAYARRLADAIGVREGEAILEIGPGHGALTKELLRTGAPVVAVEKDGALVRELRDAFAREIENGMLTLLHEDIRAFDVERSKLHSYVVAANIPYYITGEIIRSFLTSFRQPRAMALLIQKEVAQRIVAKNGKESILSLSVKAYGAPRIVSYVSRDNFSPPPTVDSAILLVDNISRSFFIGSDEQKFFEVVHAGFSSKRKSLAGNLRKKLGTAPEWLEKNRRAEDMTLAEWKAIVDSLR